MFGAKARVRELSEEVARLQGQLRALGALDVVQLQRLRADLQAEVAAQREQLGRDRAAHEALLAEQTRVARAGTEQALAAARAETHRLEGALTALRQQVVVTEETQLLQEVGVYTYQHPLSDAAAYQAQLGRLRDQTKAMARRDGGAIQATTDWTVNGSAAEGRAMVRDFSKLMLRAYNAEADNLVRSLKPYKVHSSVDRLDKVAKTIERLGKTMNIRVAVAYHRLRIEELTLTADYLEKVAAEKEREREEKVRLREERKAQLELDRERERLDKERQHYANALAAVEAKGDAEAVERLRAHLADVDRALVDVDYRAANIRAGYVYVISNIGAFGPEMVKIGMTRRLEPRDRVRELSDASVPFNFDVHALVFSQDAVGLETALHTRFADRRVNRVNARREFFRVGPVEVRELMLELTGDVLEFTEEPEALEYRQSRTEAPVPEGATS
ncbi:hypothetical protein GCM10009539_34600 [Cryptosporangium japonicum]|uniref:Bacteriophage T5 Orf172 DNA-binding domain-containing protein n=2 Tax=Cryptosporangium japonicum TaxID=80872 RepID=A0ABN0UCS8_9ACTN